ncbi:MAG: nucleotidyltransferase domain-containing protein [Ktedonobacteraceae bacterium]
MQQKIHNILLRLDSETNALVRDIIQLLAEQHSDILAIILYGSVARREERSLDEPDPSDVDLLAIFDTDDSRAIWSQNGAISHTIGLAENQHLQAPREVNVMFSSRTTQEWDPTFVANVKRDGIVLFQRGELPAPFAA